VDGHDRARELPTPEQGLDGVPEYGLPCQAAVLLGYGAAEAVPAPCGDDNGIGSRHVDGSYQLGVFIWHPWRYAELAA
jgi:hypothetical protein